MPFTIGTITMKRIALILFLFLTCTAALPLMAQEQAPRETINPAAPREYIIYDSGGFIFGAYLRAAINMNIRAEAIDGTLYWDVENGYNGMRFMNEGNYSEWLFAFETPEDEREKWWGGAYFRPAIDIPSFSYGWFNISDESYGLLIPEAYVRLGYGSGVSFWAGRRYNTKIAVGMMDYNVANLDGNGVGVENINLWSGSLNVHYLFSYDPTVTETATSETANSFAASRRWPLTCRVSTPETAPFPSSSHPPIRVLTACRMNT